MRELNEIAKDLNAVEEKITQLREEKKALREELRQVKQAMFEEAKGVKPGDLVWSKYGDMYYYIGVVIQYWNVMVVALHPLKKDNTASKITKYLSFSDFEDGKSKVDISYKFNE